ISLSKSGIPTSGNYRNYHDTANGRVGHTIDARTGYPVRANVLSATVIAPTCARADALATACMAMAPDSALMMIEAADSTKCLLVVLNPADSILYLHESPRFP
ncbi:MAG: FAD:protein FMN transferase, partial [Bacteroidales bacterium]|nr:FAD:protein FMN transferase [Bacteroidales bacterium]